MSHVDDTVKGIAQTMKLATTGQQMISLLGLIAILLAGALDKFNAKEIADEADKKLRS